MSANSRRMLAVGKREDTFRVRFHSHVVIAVYLIKSFLDEDEPNINHRFETLPCSNPNLHMQGAWLKLRCEQP